jgi:dTDP-4-dehydrorhamnose reductase
MQRNFAKNKSTVFDSFSFQGFLDVYYLGLVLKMCIDKNVVNQLIHFSSQDVMSFYEFSNLYAEIFHQPKELISRGKWPMQLMKGSGNKNKDECYYYKLDILNLEGLLKIKMPTIKESLEFTYSRFHGPKQVSKTSTNQGEELSFI